MNVMSIENLSKTVDDHPLFSSVTLGLEDGEKTGLVGHNGAGKTTFLHCLTGKIVPDEGKVSIKNGSDVAILEQAVTYAPGSSVMDYLYQAGTEKTEILRKYYSSLKNGTSCDNCLAMIEKENLWSLETDYKSYLSVFGLNIDVNTPMDMLSGGEKKKAALARVFALRPAIMLLDEPTNHLDIRTIEILETELANTSSAFILVTHDRYILNSACQTIWELDRQHFYRHLGSYEAYLERRAERIRMMQKEQDRLSSILRRELVWLQRGPQARTGKDKNRKDRIEAMLSQQRNVQDSKQTSFSSLQRRLGKNILKLDGLGKKYDDKVLFSSFSYEFKKGDKIGILGDNGCGKSTLLDIITGLEEPDEGCIEKGVNTFISYYDQLGRGLDENKTALDFISDISERMIFCGTEVSAERFLELFGFPRSRSRVKISSFSGGEKRRLYLISRLAQNPNFLILDEPTNDLDIRTMENLEEYISSFDGCTLIVSHDRAFLDCTCNSLFVFHDGMIDYVSGSYTDWKDRLAQEKKQPADIPKANPRGKREKKGLSFKEQKELEELETEIGELEELKSRLEESFSHSQADEFGTLSERNARYQQLSAEIDEKTERYFALAEKE